MWKPDLPYNELPFPPVDELETRSILRATANARAALAGLDQAVKQIPNPEILISPLSLLEAQASSEIENIVTTTDDLFRDENLRSAAPDPAVKETCAIGRLCSPGSRRFAVVPSTRISPSK